MREEGRKFKQAAFQYSEERTPRGRASTSSIWHLLRVAHHVQWRFEYEVHRPMGWSWPTFRVMVNLWAVGPMEPSRLAEVLEVTRPTISSALDKLEKAGLVSRGPHPELAGKKIVELTTEGRTAVQKAIPEQVAVEQDFTNMLDDQEVQQLDRLLNKIYDQMP